MEAAICTEMGETILRSQHKWAWLYEAENVCAGGEGVVNTQKEKGVKMRWTREGKREGRCTDLLVNMKRKKGVRCGVPGGRRDINGQDNDNRWHHPHC